ncbi:hypothetical protein SAMN05444287_0591 [Octadecabacter temperatus]|uniref:Uncharacterized protein n=1 Tax=Octadecabacter temperatus TaxID=1458307 RepID=A0A0K0Y3J3_9RHOB|nr:hypothetical protein [Octadecabacter temperatus]AKS45495.1 hypothetical protein OSB_09370 [Octadecabacter temperatus]SIN94196.1 hypothetical protein SAMN05444287_0591 [Octadecabacter temperatus]
MPQADLKYSSDMDIDAEGLLAEIEAVIGDFDSGAGKCKGRAYPAASYQHSHVFLTVQVLEKPHRDDVFMQTLLEKLTNTVDKHIKQACSRSVSVDFLPKYYATGEVPG